MTVNQMYDRACLKVKGFSQSEFLEYYNDAAEELMAKFGERYVVIPGAGTLFPIICVDDSMNIVREFDSALLAYILYCKTGNELYAAEFETKSSRAYLTVWDKQNKLTARRPRKWGYMDV